MPKWFEQAFGAVADEVGAAISDTRTKIIDEAWFGRMGTKPNPAEPAQEHDPLSERDPTSATEPSDGLYHFPIPPTPYPEAPVRFYDFPSDKQTPAPPEPSPEQDHGIDR